MAISIDALFSGAKVIQEAKDDVRRFLGIMKPICLNQSLISDKFTLPDTDRRFWWELRQGVGPRSFFQLWQVIRYGHCDRYWEGFVDDVPPIEKVIIVRNALPFFLASCEKNIPDFAEKINPYLVS